MRKINIAILLLFTCYTATAQDWQAKYDGCRVYDNCSIVRIDNKWGLCDLNGGVVIPTIYDEIQVDFYHGKYVRVKKDNKWGFYDIKGNVVLPFAFDCISYNEALAKGYIEVKNDGKWGVYGTDGKERIPLQYDLIRVVTRDGGYIGVKKGNKWGVCDTNGNTIIEPIFEYDGIRPSYILNKGYLVIKKDGLFGVCKTNGQELIEPKYDEYMNFLFGVGYSYIQVRKDSKDGLCNMRGEEIIEPQFSFINASWAPFGYIGVTLNGKCGMYDTNGVEIIKPVYEEISINGDYFDVKENGQHGLLSKNGVLLMPCKYECVYVDGNKIQVRIDFKWKDYDLSMQTIIENNDDLYNRFFSEGHSYFVKRNWKKSLENYKKAAQFKETFSVYYNIAACLFNRKKYNEAYSYYTISLNYEHSTEQDKNVRNMLTRCEQAYQKQIEVRQEIASALIGTAVEIAGAAISGSQAITTTNGTSSYNYSSYGYGNGTDAAIANANGIRLQSEARMQYEMANSPQQIMQETMQQMAAEEALKEAQWRQDYEQYKQNPGYMLNNDGSVYTWEQYKSWRLQVESQAWMESQQGKGNNNNSQGANINEEKTGKNWQSKKTESECSHCYVPGNGKCNTCGGDGWMDDGFGLGVNKLKCSSCHNQDGKCTWCHGTGKITKYQTVLE